MPVFERVTRGIRRRLGAPVPPMPRVWVIPELGVAYVHVPKTGTRSMRFALAEAAADLTANRDGKSVDRAEAAFAQHLTPARIRELAPELFTFGFVRHPLDRLHSTWKEKIQTRDDEARNVFAKHGITLETSFADFVRAIADVPDAVADGHARSMTTMLCDQDGIAVDIVGRFENMAADWSRVAGPRGLPDLPHRNRTNATGRPTWQSAYTPELWDIAVTRYARDLATFGYSADPDDVNS